MTITVELSIDLRNQGFPQRIRATQADANTRVVEVSLYDGGVAWPVPDGVDAAVGYRKPDGTAGLYDKLPDGSEALTISENTVTAILAPQVLTAPGIVSAVIILTDDSMRQLSTFPFQIYVEKNPAAGLVVSDNYINVVDAIGDLNTLVTDDKSSLVAAINEIARNNGGTISDEQIAQAVADYLEENPIDGGYSTTTEITDESTDEEVPTAAAVREYVEQNSGGNVDLTGYATEQWVKDQNFLTEVPDGYAKSSEIPKKPEDIGAQPSGNYALKSEIPSVPVQSVNGKTGAVQLSAADVGARPENWMPTAQDVGALPSTYTPPDQTAEQVGADPVGTAAVAVSSHNTDEDAHNDIRLELKAISERLTAFFDSDDQTLDELSEIVSYITNNKTLIESITTIKVSVADIVNNLTSNVSNKPLSAAQGVVLKGLIDTVSNSLANYQPKGNYALRSELPTVPTKVSQFQNDAGYLTQHQDISHKLDASKLPEAINTALAQAKASGDFDGEDGEDGYSPVRGVDYWTPADKAEIEAYIITELAKRGQLKPEPAESLEWLKANGDTSKLYVLMDKSSAFYGYIYGYELTEVEIGPSYTNQLPLAINSDGTPYVGENGEKGYKVGWRLNSSRVEKEATGRCCTGFIPVKHTDTVRFKNIKNDGVNLNGYIFFYASDFVTNSGIMYESAFDGSVFTFVPNDILQFNSLNMTAGNNTAYMRISTHTIDETSIITINEEIVEGGTTTEYAWANTGIAFVSTDYGPRISEIEEDISELEEKVEALGSGTTIPGETVSSDEVEILLPSEAVAAVGVEFNIYHKSIIRAKRDMSNYDVKVYLSDSAITCRRYAECFRLNAEEGNMGDHTLTVEVRNLMDYSVMASKSMTLHIIANTAVTGKNVLFIGDSLTFSRAGLYAAEIQYNLSNGGMVSIGSQTGSKDTNQIGDVKHEGYNGATCGGFLKANVTSAFVNPFYNPQTGEFDLAYFLSNNGYSSVDAVCLNLGHNNLGNEVAGVNDLKTIIQKIHDYDASIPVIVSLIAPLGDQNSNAHLGFSAGQMRYHWRQLIKAYITAFDNGNISNVYLSTPYFNVDQDNDLPTETVARCARDNTQIVRQNDSMHPTRIGTLKMADSYYANLLYHLR